MPTRPRSSWLGLGLAVALLGTSVSAVPAVAAEAPASVSVELAPVGPDGIGGLALLTSAEGGSTVQLLVVGAPAGTTAVVHAGDCAAIDPAPVGLLGDLADGQLQARPPARARDARRRPSRHRPPPRARPRGGPRLWRHPRG